MRVAEKKVAPGQVLAAQRAAVGVQRPQVRGRVLIVDNEEGIIRAFQLFVQGDSAFASWEFLYASSQVEAERILSRRGREIDIVVTDMRMESNESGLSVIKTAKAVNPSLDVLVITAFPSTEIATRSFKLRATDFITKPFDFNAVLREVERIRERQIRQERDANDLLSRAYQGWTDFVSQGLSGFHAASTGLTEILDESDMVAGQALLDARLLNDAVRQASEEQIELLQMVREVTAGEQLKLLEEVDLAELATSLSGQLKLIRQAVRVEAAPGLPKIEADVRILERSLKLIIKSALKAAAQDGSRSRDVVVRLRAAQDGVLVEVIDAGRRHDNLTEQVLDNPPFVGIPTFLYREHLELKLARQNLLEHKGVLMKITSDKDKGATVAIYFPPAENGGLS